MAQHHMGIVADDPNADETLKKMNAAILAAADGDWEDASHYLREILDKDDLNFVVRFLLFIFLRWKNNGVCRR